VIQSGSIPNNASIVLLAAVSGHRILLSGDIEPEAQAAVSADLAGQHFDVVKVPHHGSRFQHPMLTTWAPASIALISVGLGNDYGHPAAETIASWLAVGAIVGRTDVQGDLAAVEVDSGVGLVARSRDAAVLR
jgi:competence protein ComEC